MPDAVDLYGDAATSFPIIHEGRTYRITRATGRLRAEMELWLRRSYLETLDEIRPHVSAEVYDRKIEEFLDLVRKGHFQFDGDYHRAVMDTLSGRLAAMRILFSLHHPDITEEELTALAIHHGDEIRQANLTLHAGDIAAARKAKKKLREERKARMAAKNGSTRRK
jgi:hypothetical protein